MNQNPAGSCSARCSRVTFNKVLTTLDPPAKKFFGERSGWQVCDTPGHSPRPYNTCQLLSSQDLPTLQPEPTIQPKSQPRLQRTEQSPAAQELHIYRSRSNPGGHEQWKCITQNPWILSTVRGHHLEFTSLPRDCPPPQQEQDSHRTRPESWTGRYEEVSGALN